MMLLVIEHDNGKAGKKGFTDYQISKAENQKKERKVKKMIA